MNISLIGGGVMGEVFLNAGLTSGVFNNEKTIVCDILSDRCTELAAKYEVKTTTEPTVAFASADLVFLAIKPQDLNTIQATLSDQTCVVSIMAGIRTERLRELFSTDKIVRIMPNTPASIGEGVSVWTVSGPVSQNHQDMLRLLLTSIGTEYFVEDENALDMATAISGSGPAYVFLFLESLIKAAEAIGFTTEEAKKISIQTLYGAAAYARESTYEPSVLRTRVTSKGGTTAAGLDVLEESDFGELIKNCVRAAYSRSKELSRLR